MRRHPTARRLGFLGLAAVVLTTSRLQAGIPALPVEQWRYHFVDHDPEDTRSDTNPVVGQLTDDDGNGVVDANDSPDVLFHSVRVRNDVEIVAVHGTDGTEIRRISGPFNALGSPMVTGSLAVADIEGDGATEILTGDRDSLVIYDAAGTLLREIDWVRDPLLRGHCLGLADINGDGIVEAYDLNHVVSVDGSWGWQAPRPDGFTAEGALPIALDFDPTSPGLELFYAGQLYASDGTLLWGHQWEYGAPVVSDFDGDGVVELALNGGTTVWMLDADGELIGSPYVVDVPGGVTPPALADVNGDERMDYILVTAETVRCLNWSRTDGWSELWRSPTTNLLGASSGMPYDFDGDGASEIAYRDELGWSILDGRCGEVLSFIDFPSLSALEHPVVANIDRDPAAEILVCSFSYDPALGTVFAYEIPGSCTPRSVHGQMMTWGTDMDEDWHVPAVSVPPWTVGAGWHAQLPTVPRNLHGLTSVAVEPGREGCNEGALVSWPAAWTDDGGGVDYEVWSVPLVDARCCRLDGATMLVSGWTSTSWFDSAATGAGPRSYSVVARRIDRAECQTARACSAVVDELSGDWSPAASGALLLVTRPQPDLAFDWTTSRPLGAQEHFHLRRAVDSPQATFALVTPEGHATTTWSAPPTAAVLEFYRLFVADDCELQSVE